MNFFMATALSKSFNMTPVNQCCWSLTSEDGGRGYALTICHGETFTISECQGGYTILGQLLCCQIPNSHRGTNPIDPQTCLKALSIVTTYCEDAETMNVSVI